MGPRQQIRDGNAKMNAHPCRRRHAEGAPAPSAVTFVSCPRISAVPISPTSQGPWWPTTKACLPRSWAHCPLCTTSATQETLATSVSRYVSLRCRRIPMLGRDCWDRRRAAGHYIVREMRRMPRHICVPAARAKCGPKQETSRLEGTHGAGWIAQAGQSWTTPGAQKPPCQNLSPIQLLAGERRRRLHKQPVHKLHGPRVLPPMGS